MRGVIVVATIALSLSGCTSFSAERFDLAANQKPKGLYVFDDVPLLVVANGQASIVMVENTDRGVAVQFSAFLAKHDVSLEFFNTGGLSKVTSNQDATALPLALVDLAKTVADKLPAGLGLSGTDRAASTLQVYRINFENGEIASLTPLLSPDLRQFVNLPAPPATVGTPISVINGQAGAGTPPPACDPAELPKGQICPPK